MPFSIENVTTENRMARRMDKEALLINFFDTAVVVLSKQESLFGIDGLLARFIGADPGTAMPPVTGEDRRAAMEHASRTSAWDKVSSLYDYAVEGIEGVEGAEDTVLGGAEVLSYLKTE